MVIAIVFTIKHHKIGKAENPGSTFVVDNGGSYVPPYNTIFEIPTSVVANILRGTIY